jgi:hypothetical protein
MSDFRRFCIGVSLALFVMCLIARIVGAHGVLPLDAVIRIALLAVFCGVLVVAMFGRKSA